MSEEEEALGKLAYEAFLNARKEHTIYSDLLEAWDNTGSQWRECWIAAAKAVAERVLQEVQVAEEASE